MAIARVMDRCLDMEPYKLDDFLARNGISTQQILDEATIACKKTPHDHRLDILFDTVFDMTTEKLWNAIQEIEAERNRPVSQRD